MPERPAPPAAGRPDPQQPRYVDRGDGWTLAMELLTATFFWGGVGWLVDGWLGTGPVLMALGFVLGNGLGIYLIWVRSQDRFVQEHMELLARRGSRTDQGSAAPTDPHGASVQAPSGVSDRPSDGRRPK